MENNFQQSMDKTSGGFQMLMTETSNIGKAYMSMAMKLSQESALDTKTHELAYIAVLSATKMISGLTFHVMSAKKMGATKEEIKSAVLVGLPAVGLAVVDALEIALLAFDEGE